MEITAAVEVVRSDAFIYASRLGNLLAVYRSVLVSDDSELFRPVVEVLGNYEYSVDLCSEFDDEDIMFGRGMLTVYRLEIDD